MTPEAVLADVRAMIAEVIGEDPHIWTDPTRMVPVVEALADDLTAAGLDPESVEARAAEYVRGQPAAAIRGWEEVLRTHRSRHLRQRIAARASAPGAVLAWFVAPT